MENPSEDLEKILVGDLALYQNELDQFLQDVWLQVGDTEFNRSGLRNATDKLIEYLKRNGYYTITC